MSLPQGSPSASGPPSWQRKLDGMLARRQIAAALRLLDKVIHDSQISLFESESSQLSERRSAWLYRIDLLRRFGRLREALAWTCLECELNPENIAAQALRTRLKRQLRLIPSLDSAPPESRSESRDFWQGVAGMRKLKAVLERDVLLPQFEPDLYARYRLKLPNGILLYGPPGCGKTFIARKLAAVLGFHFIEVKPSDLGSIYVHGTQGRIGELFSEARQQSPCMLFLDELDAMMPNRSNDLQHHYSSEVNEFLVQMNEASSQRLLIVGATNRLDKIDAAALRPGRFDKKIFVGPPDLEARVELFAHYIKDRPQEPIDLCNVAQECAGYTCAELEHVVNEAARRALKSNRLICRDDLITAIAANVPAHAEACEECESEPGQQP